MKKEIKYGAILGYVNIFSTILVTLVYTPIMLRLVGQSEYGLYALISSIISYLSVLDMGFGNAMIRFVSKSQAKKENDSKINGMFLFLYIIIGIVAFIIGMALYANVEVLFSNSLTALELKKAKIIMVILVLTIAASFPLSIFDSYATASEKFTFLKILAILKTLMIPIITLPLLLLGYKSIAMVSVTSGVTLGLHILSMIFCFKKLKMKIDFNIKEYDKTLLKEIFVYSLYIFLNIIVDQIYKNTDQIILGAVSGTIMVSIYSLANQISAMNTQFSTAISSLFLPSITKTLEEKNSNKMISNIFIKVSRIQLYILLLILSGFIIFGKMFIELWVGPEYKDVYYIVLLLISPAIIPLTQNIGISILQAKNKHKFRSIMYIAIAILNIFISIPLAKNYGGIGAAIGTAIATLLGQIITMNIYYHKVIKIDIISYWKFLLKVTTPVIIISIILQKMISRLSVSWINLLIGACIYGVLYLIYIYFSMNDEEKTYISNIKNKFVK